MRGYLTLLTLASPIILARLIQTLGLVIGNLIVSGLGAEILAASAIATTISIGFFTFGSGNLFSISPLVAKEYGQKNYARIMTILTEGFYYSTALGLIIMLIFLNISHLLKLFHEPEELISLLDQYFTYFAPSILPMLWTATLLEVIIGCQKQKIIYKYSFLRMLLGIFLAYALVLGKFGFPVMGFNGLGFSVFLASAISFGGLSIFLCITERKFFLRNFKLKQFIPTGEMFKIIRFGLPIGTQLSGEILAIMLATLLIGRFGIIALAAQQITTQYLMLATMIPFGLAHAIASRISKLRGEDDSVGIHEIMYKSLIMIFIFMSILGTLYLVIPHILIHPYVYKYKRHYLEIIRLSTDFFYLMVIYQLFDGIRIVLGGILRGHGNSIPQMLIGIGSFWILGIGLIIVLMLFSNLGPILVPMSLTISVVTATTILSIYCLCKVRKV